MKSAFTTLPTHNVVQNVVQPTFCSYNVVHNIVQPTFCNQATLYTLELQIVATYIYLNVGKRLRI